MGAMIKLGISAMGLEKPAIEFLDSFVRICKFSAAHISLNLFTRSSILGWVENMCPKLPTNGFTM